VIIWILEERTELAPANAHIAAVEQLGEIAQRWGFGSQETFNRAFRKNYGVPPGANRSNAEAVSR
jgi:AraC-like DNA-binding protein